MAMKDATAYVNREHGGWGGWALQVVAAGILVALSYLAFTGQISL